MADILYKLCQIKREQDTDSHRFTIKTNIIDSLILRKWKTNYRQVSNIRRTLVGN